MTHDMAAVVGAPARPVVIRPPTRWGSLGIRQLVEYRELIYFLTKRELQIRYKQSLFGITWAAMQPLALAFIFALFFGVLANVPSQDVPYPIFALAALVPWMFCSQSVSQAAGSLVADANLIGKVYFPRLALPLAKVLSLLIDLLVALVVLTLAILVYGRSLRVEMLSAPLFLLIAVGTALGAGVLLAALNVKYRDVAVAIPLAMQIWLFSTPVIYPGALIEGAWQYIYALNPMVSVIGGVRWAFLGTPGPALVEVLISAGAAVALLLAAALYFRRTEQFFADIV